jgi:hypothetical protein
VTASEDSRRERRKSQGHDLPEPLGRVLLREVTRARVPAAPGLALELGRPFGGHCGMRPLTTFDPACPYFTAMYDLDEIG